MTGAAAREPILACDLDALFAPFLTFVTIVVTVGVLTYVAMFIGALVSSVQQLHRSGRTRHPYLLVLIPLLGLLLAFYTGATVVGLPLFAVAGLAFGYTVMFSAGSGWFRWTVFPVLPLLLETVVASR
jgi:hypothetical protein